MPQPTCTYTEQWRPVVGYEGLYNVSNHGRVRSLDRVVIAKDGRLLPIKGRIMTATAQKSGHMYISLHRDGEPHRAFVYRLVLEAFVGPCPPGMEALHYDDDTTNNALWNLRWGTSSENKLDRVRNGGHHNAKKETCRRGHPYDGDNLRVEKRSDGNTVRACRSCRAARSAVSRGAALASDFVAVADDYFRKFTGQEPPARDKTPAPTGRGEG